MTDTNEFGETVLATITVVQLPNRKIDTRLVINGVSIPGFGILLVDILRHAAAGFKCSEDDIWKWVDRERKNPTTDLYEVKPS